MKHFGLVLIVALLLGTIGVAPVAAATGPSGVTSPAGAQFDAGSSFTHVVRSGDTLARIASRYGLTLSALLRANTQIYNPNRIFAGQRITIPGSGGSGTASVKIALIALNDGQVGCGDGVVRVTRNIAPTQAPLTAAIRELVSIRGQTYGQSGLYNALYQSNLKVAGVTLKSGKANIYLTGTLRLGGVCDSPRVKAQFDSTARQFSTVSQVQVYVNGTPLERLLSSK